MTAQAPKSVSRSNLKIVLILVGLVALLCIGLSVLPKIRGPVEPRVTMPSSSSSSSSAQDAWYACTTAIDKKFGLSYLDAQRFDASAVSGSGPYEMSVYYPKTNATFFCSVSRTADGNWYVVATH